MNDNLGQIYICYSFALLIFLEPYIIIEILSNITFKNRRHPSIYLRPFMISQGNIMMCNAFVGGFAGPIASS